MLREFGPSEWHVIPGEVLRFVSPVEFTTDDEPCEEWLMFSFTCASHALPRLWEPKESETLDSWREYFEELPDDTQIG